MLTRQCMIRRRTTLKKSDKIQSFAITSLFFDVLTFLGRHCCVLRNSRRACSLFIFLFLESGRRVDFWESQRSVRRATILPHLPRNRLQGRPPRSPCASRPLNHSSYSNLIAISQPLGLPGRLFPDRHVDSLLQSTTVCARHCVESRGFGNRSRSRART